MVSALDKEIENGRLSVTARGITSWGCFLATLAMTASAWKDVFDGKPYLCAIAVTWFLVFNWLADVLVEVFWMRNVVAASRSLAKNLFLGPMARAYTHAGAARATRLLLVCAALWTVSGTWLRLLLCVYCLLALYASIGAYQRARGFPVMASAAASFHPPVYVWGILSALFAVSLAVTSVDIWRTTWDTMARTGTSTPLWAGLYAAALLLLLEWIGHSEVNVTRVQLWHRIRTDVLLGGIGADSAWSYAVHVRDGQSLHVATNAIWNDIERAIAALEKSVSNIGDGIDSRTHAETGAEPPLESPRAQAVGPFNAIDEITNDVLALHGRVSDMWRFLYTILAQAGSVETEGVRQEIGAMAGDAAGRMKRTLATLGALALGTRNRQDPYLQSAGRACASAGALLVGMSADMSWLASAALQDGSVPFIRSLARRRRSKRFEEFEQFATALTRTLF